MQILLLLTLPPPPPPPPLLLLQAQAAPSPAELLLREGTYRAIGEVYVHLRSRVNFPAWYASELRGLLAEQQAVAAPGEWGRPARTCPWWGW